MAEATGLTYRTQAQQVLTPRVSCIKKIYAAVPTPTTPTLRRRHPLHHSSTTEIPRPLHRAQLQSAHTLAPKCGGRPFYSSVCLSRTRSLLRTFKTSRHQKYLLPAWFHTTARYQYVHNQILQMAARQHAQRHWRGLRRALTACVLPSMRIQSRYWP